MNILIVEDEATSREMLLSILKSEGDHTILTAADGDDALKLMEDPRHPFDVVFLDLMLPSISGLDLLERVRATPACRFVRVIICTTSTDSATVVRAARLGRPPLHGEALRQDPGLRAAEHHQGRDRRPAEDREARGGRRPPGHRHSGLQGEGGCDARPHGALADPGQGRGPARPTASSSPSDTGRLKTDALDLGLREVGRRFSTLETRLSIEPQGEVPDSRAIEIAFIMSHLHGELNRVRSVLKIIAPDKPQS